MYVAGPGKSKGDLGMVGVAGMTGIGVAPGVR
jgi:hypothetical protein